MDKVLEIDPPPFDIRNCPVWAIPQIAYFKKITRNSQILFFVNYYNGMGELGVTIDGQMHICYIEKKHMNRLHGFIFKWWW